MWLGLCFALVCVMLQYYQDNRLVIHFAFYVTLVIPQVYSVCAVISYFYASLCVLALCAVATW